MKKEITQEQKIKAITQLAIALKNKKLKHLGLWIDEKPTELSDKPKSNNTLEK